MQYPHSYIAPILTVDLVLFAIIDDVLSVLLLKRPDEPFKDHWALPGGYVPAGETTLQALSRVIDYKVGMDVEEDLTYLEQLYAFDTVARDPRGHAVSVTYLGCARDIAEAAPHSNVRFFPVDATPGLAFDHENIIAFGRERLAATMGYSSAARAFLPKMFTLTELQKVHESVYGHPLDKRNFRKKIMSLDLLVDTHTVQAGKIQRPARLYMFAV